MSLEVKEKLKELLNFDVTYFQNDKQNKIKKMTKEIETDLKKIENLKESELFCIKGLMYSVGDNYKKESEQYFTKSLKLDPTNVQAWNGLGESQIKKKDLSKAEFYFLSALKIKRNPDSLCKLSSINRLNGKESLSYSKEAIALDVTNADSWYSHGNSYFSQYMNHSLNKNDLMNSLKCYNKSHDLGLKIPEMFFNRSIVLKYLERFSESHEGFKRAFDIDPNFTMAKQEYQEIERCMNQMKDLSQHVSMENKFDKKDISISNFMELMKSESFEGELKLIVLEKVKFTNLMILGVVDCDSKISFCSVYFVSPKAIEIGDSIHILKHGFNVKEQSFQDFKFDIISLKNPTTFKINEKLVSGEYLRRMKCNW